MSNYTIVYTDSYDLIMHNMGEYLYQRRSGGDWALYDYHDWDYVKVNPNRTAPIEDKEVAKIAMMIGDF